MALVPSDKEKGLKTPVWDEYKSIVNHAEGREVGVAVMGVIVSLLRSDSRLHVN